MESQIREILEEAKVHFDRGELVKALPLYQSILKTEPNHAVASYNIACILVKLGKLEAATTFFAKAAVSSNPKLIFLEAYIKHLLKTGQIKKLSSLSKRTNFSAEFQNTIHSSLDPNSPSIRRYLLHAINYIDHLTNLKKVNLARERILNLLTILPNQHEVLHLSGRCYIAEGAYDAAVAELKNLTNKKNVSCEVFNDLIYALVKLQDFPAASKYVELMNARGISNERGDYLSLVVLNNTAKYSQALARASHVAASNRNNLELARAAYKSSEVKLCLFHLEKINEPSVEANDLKALAFIRQGDIEKAKDILFEMVENSPTIDRYTNLISCLRKPTDMPELLKVLQDAHSTYPFNEFIFLQFAEVLFKTGKIRALELLIHNAVDSLHDKTEFYLARSFLHQLRNEVDQSIEVLLTSQYQGNKKQLIRDHVKLIAFSGCLINKTSDNNVAIPLKASLDVLLPEVSEELDKSCLQLPGFIHSENKLRHLIKPSYQGTFKSVTAMYHFGRSGSGLLHSLIDDHPQILTTPSYFLHDFFSRDFVHALNGKSSTEIVELIFEKFPFLFNPKKYNYLSFFGTLKDRFPENEGLLSLGTSKRDCHIVDKKAFSEKFLRLLDSNLEVCPASIFEKLHIAYANSSVSSDTVKCIFYHIHNSSPATIARFSQLVPDSHALVVVREPLQSLESWIGNLLGHGFYHETFYNCIITMVSQTFRSYYFNQGTFGIRLEDIKTQHYKTMLKLCNFLNVDYSESMETMTSNGLRWWGDQSSANYQVEGHKISGSIAINRRLGTVFSASDLCALNTLFYNLKGIFNYSNAHDFSESRSELLHKLSNFFDFEKEVCNVHGVSCEDLKSTINYNSFRAFIRHYLNIYKTLTDKDFIKPI